MLGELFVSHQIIFSENEQPLPELGSFFIFPTSLVQEGSSAQNTDLLLFLICQRPGLFQEIQGGGKFAVFGIDLSQSFSYPRTTAIGGRTSPKSFIISKVLPLRQDPERYARECL